MVIFPKAKINIGLLITEKRTDGFHNIETIFYPVGLCDALEFVVPEKPVREDILNVSGLLADLDPADNLVLKAVKKIRDIRDFPFLNIHLHKAIPAGAGLGGGSSDAATFMRALNNYFGLDITNEKLKKLALELGSDCPFFIDSVPAFAKGRGELLTPVDHVKSGYHILMINPGIHVSTKEAYSSITPKSPVQDLKDLYDPDPSKWKDLIINDFEESVFRRYPRIAEIKKMLYNLGALYSSMSGSGSTVYGIFKSKPEIPVSVRDLVIYSERL
jgi:4-diphosphocytidyl-2-C-methyl-D-erythritol kinase